MVAIPKPEFEPYDIPEYFKRSLKLVGCYFVGACKKELNDSEFLKVIISINLRGNQIFAQYGFCVAKKTKPELRRPTEEEIQIVVEYFKLKKFDRVVVNEIVNLFEEVEV